MDKLQKLVLIRWYDSFHPNNCGWMDEEDVKEFLEDTDYVCENIGWIIDENEHLVTIASMRSGEHNTLSHIQRIPTGCILERKEF